LQQVVSWVQRIASQLHLTQEQFDAMQREVAESYAADRGQALLAAALAQD